MCARSSPQRASPIRFLCITCVMATKLKCQDCACSHVVRECVIGNCVSSYMRDSGEGIRCIHQVYITCGRFASMQLFSQRSHVDILRETHKLLAAHGHSLHFIEFNSNAAFTRVFDTFLLGCGSSLLANSSALMALISRSLVKFQRAPAGCFVPLLPCHFCITCGPFFGFSASIAA